MTIKREALHQKTNLYTGKEARDIVVAHSSRAHDMLNVRELGQEFPTVVQYLGAKGLYLATADDNDLGTFKWRGAVVGAQALKDQGATSLWTASAGNHARGAVFAARELGMDIDVGVPMTAPPAKKEGLVQLWNNRERMRLHIHGNTFDETLQWALSQADEGNFLSPYDDPNVIRGQGTILDAILKAMGDDMPDDIVAPTGGGGLTAGLLQRRDELGLGQIAIHAVEAPGSDSLSQSLNNRQLTQATRPNRRFAGSAVNYVGQYALDICRRSSNFSITTVQQETVEDVIYGYELDRQERSLADTPHYEPTTIVAIAGLQKIVADVGSDHKIVVVGTGHNAPLNPSEPFQRFTRVLLGQHL